jgi:RHS repeat-associated protein
VNTSYSYDSLSRLLSILHQAGETTIDGATYTLDNAGNRISKLNWLNGITENYTYDPIYQLMQVQQTANGNQNTTESYSYDAVGNRLSSLNVPSYSYNNANELTSSADGYSYTYDNNGNMLTKANSSGTTQYSWNFENWLASVTLPNGGGVVTFKYDPFGRRIQKISSVSTTTYASESFSPVEELDPSGNVLSRGSYGPWTDEILAETQGTGTAYYEQDGVGSVTSLSNSTGTLANTYRYDSFGNVLSSSGSLISSFQYAGREFDDESGLNYLRFRYVDSTIGRFMSEDPLEFEGGFNFYTYVQNNPLLFSDPFGLSSEVFNRANGTLTLLDRDGHVVIVCQAANNTARSSNGPWPNGTYHFAYHNNHTADPNGPYGSHGIDVFHVPGRPGIGVHSGRANNGGPNHPTMGCVRTDDNCMQHIRELEAHDPMTGITIQ